MKYPNDFINKIVLGDCLEVMKDIPDKSIDLIITSPPYNAKKEYENLLSFQDYKEFAFYWTLEAKRTLRNAGSFWLNVGYMKLGKNETIPLTYVYYDLIGLPLVQEIVWHYEGGMSYKKRFTHRTERWQWYSIMPNNVTFNLNAIRDLSLNRTIDKRNNPLGKNPTDYWYFDRVVNGTGKVKEKTSHPCQFPEKMIERIILACSNVDELILDPFIGSGTTAIACLNTNRRFIGIEKDEKYYKIACDRVQNEMV